MREFSFDGEIISVPEAQLPDVGTEPLVSIVLTAFQRHNQLRNTLRSLRGQTYKKTEIIVVEADTDGGLTKQVCKDFGVKYLQRLNKSDRRTAVTNNIGIRNSHGEVIIIQCAECRHETNDSIEKIIQPIIQDSSVSTFPGVIDLDEQGAVIGWKYHSSTHPHCFITFCQAFSREAIYRIGGFDENYVNWGLEDCDAAFRLQFSGVECRHVPAVVAHQWHEPPPQSEEHTDLQGYYDAKIAAIKADTETVVANQGKDWGNVNT